AVRGGGGGRGGRVGRATNYWTTLAHEVHLNNVNLEGVDPIFLNIQPQQPAVQLPEQDMANDPEGDAELGQVPEVDGENNNNNN
ncbi:unnamed protein product, partial [Allacma fusca]